MKANIKYKLNSEESIVFLDVKSFYTNVPLKDTIDIALILYVMMKEIDSSNQTLILKILFLAQNFLKVGMLQGKLEIEPQLRMKGNGKKFALKNLSDRQVRPPRKMHRKSAKELDDIKLQGWVDELLSVGPKHRERDKFNDVHFLADIYKVFLNLN